jgi:hypothetical protein
MLLHKANIEIQLVMEERSNMLNRTRNHLFKIIGIGIVFAINLLLSATPAKAQANFSETFDNVGTTNAGQDGPQNLITRGWIFRNQSSPRGTTSWHDGYLPSVNPIWPSPQSGAGYMAVEGTSADFFGGRVSNWAILPQQSSQRAGDVLSFYANNLDSHNIPTLQVRYSPGGGTSTGTGADGVGDFTTLLLNINPLPVGGWNLYRITLPGAGRIALRYYIAQACNFGCASAYTGIDSMSIGGAPAPACNLPPVPAAGQTVTWRAAASPFRVCQNIGIPPGATVVVEPGVRVDFDPDRQLSVNGTLNIQGNATARVTFTGPAAYPPIVDAVNGTVNASFTDFTGQFLVESGSTIRLADCGFSGNGVLLSRELPLVAPYVLLERCRFNSTQFTTSDAIVVLRNNTFTDTYALILRGYADVTATNTFIGKPLQIDREHAVQPFYLDGVNASSVATGGGLALSGWNFLLGPRTVLQNNLFPLELQGGLMPGSTVPLTGNAYNAIDVKNGGFMGDGRWSKLGLPYRLTQLSGDLPGGYLTIDPGVTVEADPGTMLVFRSTRRLIAEGLPTAPITFKSTQPGQVWEGFRFQTNVSECPRLDYCKINDARFGAMSSDNLLYVDNTTFQNNQTGANASSYGWTIFGKTRFLGNAVGASVSELGTLGLRNLTNPNSFEGNTAAIDAFNIGSASDARNTWWNHPTGPQAPQNPGGQGDPIIGAGATGISVIPYLTAPPDSANTPPVVRLEEPGLIWNGHSPLPGYLLDQGTKYIIRWQAQDSDAIVKQRILFSPDGHYPDRFVVVADNLPGNQRSFEWTVPNPGFATTFLPQVLRVVAVDAAGQEGWDETPLVVPSGNLQGELTITTNLTGMTFYAGQSIPDLTWTGSLSDFPTLEPFVILESDGAAIEGINVTGKGIFFSKFPSVSTDTARLAIRARNNSNDIKWFFAPGYFSIRHDPRLNFVPPAVQLLTPATGAVFAAGATVPITWTASDDEGLYSFDIQGSYDGGRTWHFITRDLPATARSYNWPLPPSVAISNVRVRVIARDIRFQNNSSGADRTFNLGSVVPPPPPAATLVSVSLNPTSVTGGSPSQATVTLSAAAPADGAVVSLSSSNAAIAVVPVTVTVNAGALSASIPVSTASVTASSSVTITAIYAGVQRTATLTVTPAAPPPQGDTVAITQADYVSSKRLLRVQATSTSSTATLRVYVTSTNALIGTLINAGGGRYTGALNWSSNPQNITVRSSLGGSATRTVALK